VTTQQHAVRIGLLMAGASVLLAWVFRHTEINFADGLRYIHQAEQIDRGDWQSGLFYGIDHPLHPLAIAVTHRVLGGAGPVSWERAALVLCFASGVLLAVPVYLLSHAILDDNAGRLAAMLVMANPMISLVVSNVLSESTFLLWWCFGLWGAVRWLREGRLRWLAPVLLFSVLAYLTRPEGMLLPAALAATMLIVAARRARARELARSWRAFAVLVLGLIVLAGPYIAIKGGVGTKPGIARVIGLAPQSPPLALEREKPLQPGQTTYEAYRYASIRMHKILRSAVSPGLYPFALLGLVMATTARTHRSERLFLGVVLAASAVALVRLHVTAGYSTGRHGLVPGLILTLAAAHALTRLARWIALPGRWLGPLGDRPRACAALTSLLLVLLVLIPQLRALGPFNRDPFGVYHAAARWLRENTRPGDQVLDLNDWPLYVSGLPGRTFAQVYEGAADPNLRWLLVRSPHVAGRGHYNQVIRKLIAGRRPVALLPPDPGPREIQIRIYDCQAARSVMNPTPETTPARSHSQRRALAADIAF
jgi:4-amino-4-deoxy-L-arabinose transferase-like glycosyltransferase